MTQKKSLFSVLTAALLLCIFALPSCHQINGHGSVVHEERSLAGFNTIVSTIPTDIYITEGKTYQVSLEGQQNILNVVESKLEDNRLTFSIKKPYYISGGIRLIIRITCPNINGLFNQGSGNMAVLSPCESRTLNLKNVGSGKIEMTALNAQQLSLSIAGSGNISIKKGEIKNLSALLTGSGNIKAEQLNVQKATIKLTGSGSIRIGQCANLDATILGSGNIRYKNNSSIQKNVKILGSGNVMAY